MKLVVLTGAGASKGSTGVIRDTKYENPPLGSCLYEELEKRFPRRFEEISQKFGREDIQDFEAKMYKITKDDDPSVNPAEINTLIAIFFSEFHLTSNSTYEKLIRVIDKKTQNYIISTLNYDVLLEQAAYRLKKTVNWDPIPQTDAFIWKLHGTCNSYFTGVTGNLGGVYIGIKARPQISGLSFTQNFQEIPKTLCKYPSGPLMSFYMKGKPTIVGEQFLINLQKEWAKQVKKADKILLIGVNPHFDDTHIWDPILNSKGKIGYIGGGLEKLKNEVGDQRCEDLGNSFQGSIPCIETFLV